MTDDLDKLTADDISESRFTRQSDVKQATNTTITDVVQEKVGKTGQIKWCLELDKFEKPLILKPAISNALAAITGSKKAKDWIGHTIQVYVNPDVEFQGERVGGIRVRRQSEVPF